ncbi:MAG: alpha-amylase family glycosyl hydrolase [bacterium]|nr:alpha-amylase family glycosyl hydrolase [bacterium]
MENSLWWKNVVLYELYVDKFAGDFINLAANLDYFTALGIDCLHLLPHYPSPLIDDGYDISDYRAIRSDLGTLDDFCAFVKEAHKRNIRIMTDFVLNHVSSQHPWFCEARSSNNNAKRDYFIWSETGAELKDSLNAFPHLKSSNWIYNTLTNDYYYATFYPEQPDLNWNNPRVYEEMMEIMNFWIACGVDGFRLDAASHLVKKEGTSSKGLEETHALLKNIRSHLVHTAPEVALLAEVHDTLDEVKKYFGNGRGDECNLAYHFQVSEDLMLAVIRNDRAQVDTLIAASSDIPADCQWVAFLRNHDELSLKTLDSDAAKELLDYCDPERKYLFDKNKGLSMRLASMFGGDTQKIKNAFSLLLSLPASVVIYYGEEIGMVNDESIGEQKDTRRYVRGTFPTFNLQVQPGDKFF